MQNKYILILIAVVVVLGILSYFYKSNKIENYMENDKKVYAISNVSLDTSSGVPVFKHLSRPGNGSMLLIIPWGDKYLITKFSWLVVPSMIATQEEGGTYWFEDGKFTPTKVDLKYSPVTKVLEGSIEDKGQAMSIHVQPNQDMVEINSADEFKKINNLPGFSSATYSE